MGRARRHLSAICEALRPVVICLVVTPHYGHGAPPEEGSCDPVPTGPWQFGAHAPLLLQGSDGAALQREIAGRRALLAVSQRVRYEAFKEARQVRPGAGTTVERHSNISFSLGMQGKPKAKGSKRKKGGAKRKRGRKGYEDILRRGQRKSTDATILKRLGWSPERFVLAICAWLYFTAIGCCCWAQQNKDGRLEIPGAQEEVDDPEEVKAPWTLDEDTYGLAIAVFVKDTTAMATGAGSTSLRTSRMMLSVLLVYVNIGFQIFLTLQVKRFITPRAVDHIRDAYGEFEWRMHGSNMSHMKISPGGSSEGLVVGQPEYFDPSLFAEIPPDLKDEVCHIPFSQPAFLLAVLFLWTLTCIGDVKRCLILFERLIVFMPTADSTLDVFPPLPLRCASLPEGSSPGLPSSPGSPFSAGSSLGRRELQRRPVQGLTMRMKLFVCWAILVPRLCIVGDLLWVGCRWLAATINFGDLLLNAVALEFILLLKDMLYTVLASSRSKKDLLNLDIKLYCKDRPTFATFLGSFLWGAAALAWAIIYTRYGQAVLPDYNWDVRSLCSGWLAGEV